MAADQELVLCRLSPSTGIHRAFRGERVTRAVERDMWLALNFRHSEHWTFDLLSARPSYFPSTPPTLFHLLPVLASLRP